jgi:transcriptional regulator with XRE-family HTH domain
VPTIAELRKARRVTQFELAQLVGVRPESIFNWEKGRTIPYDRHLRKLGEVFGIDPNDIELIEPETDEGKDAA